MNKRITAFAIATGATALLIPTSLQAQTTSIRDLQQNPRGITVSGEVTSVVGNDFVLDDESSV